MQIYLRKSCEKMDFDEVLMRVSAKMVDIWLIYVCVSQKKVVILRRNWDSGQKLRKTFIGSQRTQRKQNGELSELSEFF